MRVSPWRAVEAQHQISTRKLVASAEEQLMLEQLLDGAKPANIAPKLHYLLSTPFRYPPLRHGSRFGSRQQRGIWYGSESHRTMFAEVAYYRLLFLEGTEANLSPIITQVTAFTARAGGARGADLTIPPFEAFRRAIASRTSYSQSQALGREMRSAGVSVFRYPSARDAGGVNVAVLAPAAFGASKPREFQTWHCLAERGGVELSRSDFVTREAYYFPRSMFLVSERLPAPAL